GEYLAVRGQLAAAHLPLPKRVADDGAIGRAREGFILRLEQPAPPGRYTENGKEFAAYLETLCAPTLVAFAQPQTELAPCRQPIKGFLPAPRRFPHWSRDAAVFSWVKPHAAISTHNPNFGEFVRPIDRQAAQAHGIKQLKDRRVRANAQRQRDDD